MWKIKLFQDAEFKITGHKEGLRDEDMCFVLETEDGVSFEAKPQGTREVREDYLKNAASYVGKLATVKFFNYTEYGTPNLPSFKCVREDGI